MYFSSFSRKSRVYLDGSSEAHTSYCNLFQFLSFHLLPSEQLLISIEGKQTFINILIDAFFLWLVNTAPTGILMYM